LTGLALFEFFAAFGQFQFKFDQRYPGRQFFTLFILCLKKATGRADDEEAGFRCPRPWNIVSMPPLQHR
jgi:hypothetical protein